MKRETLEEKTSEELVELLKEDASLASKFDEYSLWDRFYFDNWRNLLSDQAQFKKKAKHYASGWVAILILNPELAQECDKWEKFDDWEWCKLLSEQPQFANKCDRWEYFVGWMWEELLGKQPQFEEKAK